MFKNIKLFFVPANCLFSCVANQNSFLRPHSTFFPDLVKNVLNILVKFAIIIVVVVGVVVVVVRAT